MSEKGPKGYDVIETTTDLGVVLRQYPDDNDDLARIIDLSHPKNRAQAAIATALKRRGTVTVTSLPDSKGTITISRLVEK